MKSVEKSRRKNYAAHPYETPLVHDPASDRPSQTAAIAPLPFYPNLYPAVKSLAATLVLTYLEIHHPPSPANQWATASPPVAISMDEVARNLQLSRRMLRRCLLYISTWFRDDQERWRAARAGREFLQPEHKRFGTVKPYSIIGPRNDRPGIVLVLRRNVLYLAHLLEQAGCAAMSTGDLEYTAIGRNHSASGNSAPTLSIVAQRKSLAEILVSASALAGDRRNTRYEQTRRSRGARTLEPSATDPVLPDSILARFKKS